MIWKCQIIIGCRMASVTDGIVFGDIVGACPAPEGEDVAGGLGILMRLMTDGALHAISTVKVSSNWEIFVYICFTQ